MRGHFSPFAPPRIQGEKCPQMKRPLGFLGFLLILLGCWTLPAWGQEQKGPLTLAECYRLALKQSEEIAIRQELIAESEGRFQQAFSGVLPKVAFSSSDKRQDGSGGSAFTLRQVPERKFTFSQPLFSGFKEFAAMNLSKAQGRQRALEKNRAEQLLFLDVTDAFTLLVEERKDLEALESVRNALAERMEELRVREKLGRSRTSEVVAAAAQGYRVEAEVALVQSEEVVARQLLEFLTGLPSVGEVAEETAVPSLEEEKFYLARTISRSDVRATEEAATAAGEEVRIAKAKIWPTVSLEGNYFVERAGAAKDVDWDAALKVDLPLFEGRQTAGAVKEASSRARQAELRLTEAGRRAASETRQAYAKVQSALARSEALKKAVAAAEENYLLQVEDFRRSLVNHLEVLQALHDLENGRRELIHAQQEVRRAYGRLQVAIGEVRSS